MHKCAGIGKLTHMIHDNSNTNAACRGQIHTVNCAGHSTVRLLGTRSWSIHEGELFYCNNSSTATQTNQHDDHTVSSASLQRITVTFMKEDLLKDWAVFECKDCEYVQVRACSPHQHLQCLRITCDSTQH